MEKGVPFDRSLVPQIEKQSVKVCQFADCIDIAKRLLHQLGYEVQFSEKENELVVIRSNIVKSVILKGLSGNIEEEIKRTANLLMLNKPFSDETLKNLEQLITLKLKSIGYREASIMSNVVEKKEGVYVEVLISPGALYYVKEVEVVCPHKFKKLVLNKFRNFRLKAVNMKDIRDTVEAIEDFMVKRGFYNSSVKFMLIPIEEKEFFLVRKKPVKLFVKVRLGKHYSVLFEGNNRFNENLLQKVLTFQSSRSVDEFEVENSRKKIEIFYKNRGFPFVKVSVSLSEKENEVFIVFRIHEGRKVVVKRVFSPVNLPEFQELINKPFCLEKVESLKRKIESVFLNRGFRNAKVEFTVKGNDLEFTVRKGKCYVVTAIFVGNDRLMCTEKLELSLPVPYTPKLVEEIKTKIESCYERKGFVYSKVNVNVEFSEEIEKVSVTLHIKVIPGSRYRTGYVVFSGLKRTDLKWISNLLILKPGEIYSKSRTVKQYSVLTESRLFSSVSLEEVVYDSTVSELFRISEGSRLSARGFIGFGSDSGYVLNGFASSTTPFGLGMKYFLFGNYRQKESYDLVFKMNKPAFPWRTYETSYSVVKKEQIYESFKTDRTLYRFSLTRKVSRAFSQTFGMEISREKLKDTTIQTENRFVKRSLFYTHSYDRRNSLTNPTEGFLMRFYLSLSGQLLGGNTDFLMTDFKFLYLIPISVVEKSTVAIRTGVGLIQSIKGSSVPIQDRFFLGGAESIRGYKFGTISPRDSRGNFIGGEVYGLFSIEFRYGIRKNLQLALFYDTGNVFPKVSDFRLNLSNWYSSVGFGIRYITPVGPLRLDYGLKLKKLENQGPGRIHISFGLPF